MRYDAIFKLNVGRKSSGAERCSPTASDGDAFHPLAENFPDKIDQRFGVLR